MAPVILPPPPLAEIKLPTVALPVTVRLPKVPTLVKLEVTTDDFSTVPLKLAALA